MIELTKILTDHLASQTSRVSADHYLNPKRFDQNILANLIHYDLLGWSIIPGIQGTKKPIVLWKNKARMPLRRLLSESASYGMTPGHHPNFAIKLGQSKLCVLDIDQHADGPDGCESFAQLVHQYGTLPTTPADSRNHFYFKLPADLDFQKTVVDIAPGVQLMSGRTDKSEDIDHILWAPPSTHHSGVEYQWLHGLAPWETELAELPRWVCDLAAKHWEKAKATVDHHRSTSPGVTLPSGLRELPSTDQITARARAYMDKVKPAVSGQHGHDATMYAACRLVLGFDLSPADALPLLEEWNDRCSPPWDTSDLLRKLHEADKQSGPRGYLRDAALPARRGFSDADAPDMSDISIGSSSSSSGSKSSNKLDVEEAVRETAKIRRKSRPARTPEPLSIPDSPVPELSEILDDIEDLRCKWHRFTIYPQLLELFQVRLETIAGSEATLPLHEEERRRLHNDILSAKRLRELEHSGKHAPTVGMPCPNKICKSFCNERKNLFRIAEFDCGTWTCPTCRVKLAAKWKSHLEDCMMPAESLYHGDIDPSTQYRTRTRKTRRGPEDKLEEFSPAWAATYKQMVRSARRAGRTLDYRRVRIPGRLLLISTEPFTTADGTPARPVDASAAIWINQHEIDAIDTDRPISVSDGWKLPTETKTQQGWKSVGTFKNRIDDTYYSLAPILAAAVEKGLSLNDSGPLGLFVAARWDSAFRGDQSEAEALHRRILRSIDPVFSIDPAAPLDPSRREKEPIPVF